MLFIKAIHKTIKIIVLYMQFSWSDDDGDAKDRK